MKRSKITTLFLVGLIGLTSMLAVGCSDDDNTSTGPENETLSSRDTNMVSSMVGDAMFSTPLQTVALSEALVNNSPHIVGKSGTGQVMSLSDDDEIIITSVNSYTYADGWHVFDFEAVVVDTETDDTVDVVGVDSVQVLVDGDPVQEVNDSDFVNGLLARAHVDWDFRTAEVSADANHRIDIGVAVQEMDTIVTVSGSVNDTLDVVSVEDSLTCDITIRLDQVLDSLQVYANADDDDCPLSGFVASTAGITADCQGTGDSDDTLQVNGVWAVTATVNGDGTVTVTYDGPIVSWTVTEDCDEVEASKARWWSAR
ncbi:hypothetical protein GF377_07020 [candidate division GN15 bacterium]|nr:hypothetical protein [candidate division GN15 bacterium]